MRSNSPETRQDPPVLRRDFLKYTGILATSAALSSCLTPTQNNVSTKQLTEEPKDTDSKQMHEALEDLIGRQTILDTPFLLGEYRATFHSDGSISVDGNRNKCTSIIANKGLECEQTYDVQMMLSMGGNTVQYDGTHFVFSSMLLGTGRVTTEEMQDALETLARPTEVDEEIELNVQSAIEANSTVAAAAWLTGNTIAESANSTVVFQRVQTADLSNHAVIGREASVMEVTQASPLEPQNTAQETKGVGALIRELLKKKQES